LKFLPAQLAGLMRHPEHRRNAKVLLRVLGALVVVVALYSVGFHFIMSAHEGREYSWVTGVYWTLTVMSTLGFGDITFNSDLGRLFSVGVLLSGVVMLLIVLPFTFIRHFYSPWLEAQLRRRAPREVPEGTRDHVVLCRFDDLARGLVPRLVEAGIPYYVIEPDPAVAGNLFGDGVSVIAGEVDSRETYSRLAVERARIVVANLDDATNTNITLTVREVSAEVPIVAIVEDRDSVDLLLLSGATSAVPMKDRLGQHLASRTGVGHQRSRVLGHYGEIVLAEFPLKGTPFSGKRLRSCGLRERTGLSLVGLWDHGHLVRGDPETKLAPFGVAVVCGTDQQLAKLDALLAKTARAPGQVLVIGGGRVGQAVLRELRTEKVEAAVLDSDSRLRRVLKELADPVVIGMASDLEALRKAGLEQSRGVVITTHDDATNIFLTSYVRKLVPEIHIVSRVTHERNIEAILRAGADFVLSFTTLGVKKLLAFISRQELILLGEDVDLFELPIPAALHDVPLAESRIGARTGLSVIGLRDGDQVTPIEDGATRLVQGWSLLALGTKEQCCRYRKEFA